MRRNRRLLGSLAFALFEWIATAAVFLFALWLRDRYVDRTFLRGPVLELLPVVLIVWPVLLWVFGPFRRPRTTPLWREALHVLWIVGLGAGILATFSFLRQSFLVSRFFLAIFLALDFAALVFLRTAASWFRRHERKRGYDRSYVVVAGTGKRARTHVAGLLRNPGWGLEVVGLLSETKIARTDVLGLPVLGALADLEGVLRDRVVDEVHFSLSRTSLEALNEAIRTCEEIGVSTRILLPGLRERKMNVRMEFMDGVPFLSLSKNPDRELALLVKRLIDLSASAVGLLLLSPLLLITAILIKLTSPGPVLFRQRRSGVNGRTFTLYKFRTMVADAEERKESLLALNEMDGPVFKIKDDPRITRLGRALRKLSIDELPQLWNVLRGDMSLVGPRPPVPQEVKKYERWQRRRLSMRPGITCIWQVSGRNDVDFRRWMEMDLEYIDNWSLALDFKILLKTVPAVLSSRGAS